MRNCKLKDEDEFVYIGLEMDKTDVLKTEFEYMVKNNI